MPRSGTLRSIASVVAACIAWVGLTCSAVEPDGTPLGKPDWAGLDKLLWAGDYDAAATAAAEIATALKPQRRDPDFLARSIGLFRALMRRGFAELQLGRLDAAASTFDQAHRILKDSDVRRLLSIEARSANAKVMSTLVMLDINLVEVLNLRMAVIIERLKLANLDRGSRDDQSPEQRAALDEQVRRWLDDLESIERSAVEARKTLAERIEKGGPAILASPHNRALVGRFRPALVAGTVALELSRLPVADSLPGAGTPATPPAALDDRVGLATSRRRFAEAATALEEAIALAAPKGAASLKPEQSIESLLMRVELLTREGEASLESGEATLGRERFTKVVELLKQIAVLRKIPQPESHPDLFEPLLFLAESILDEARMELDTGDPARARTVIIEAGKILARAEGLPFPEEHPLRGTLTRLRVRLDADLARAGATIPGTDAADAAARRLRRALDGTAFSEGDASF